jgi:hydroxymethylpyrimidine pyrophosphatase-like HAD family hydrolase
MNYIDNRPATIFCDIDGTLVTHNKPTEQFHTKLKLLDGTIEKLLEWDKKGYNIILTTGRKESLRHITEQQLNEVGIIYDQLIMGIGGGIRYLINDNKVDSSKTAFSYNINRNEGIKNINLEIRK